MICCVLKAFRKNILSCKSFNIQLERMSISEVVDVKRKLEDGTPDSSSKKPKLSDENTVDEILKTASESSKQKRKPKKVVLLLSYLGKEYFGMQRNHNVSTVEGSLLNALVQANIILQSECDLPRNMKFQRAARTDKGVSAVRQIVSLKIPQNEINNDLPEKVNKHLPPEIRVIAVKRVTQSFDAKIACDARTYAYMLPTFAFSDSENDENYRITADRMEEVNKILKNYIGTHNFYNFTSGRLPGDPSCKRYIISCECGPPFESYGLEFCVIKIKGQSFMLHQIRKMVGLVIAMIRKLADETVMHKVWQNERLDVPIAPGLGLMLEELHYDWYNSKYGSDGMHEALVWDEYDEVVNTFKKDKICANIAEAERDEKSMLQWLETLVYHCYDVREAGPPAMLPATGKTEECSNENETSLSEDIVANQQQNEKSTTDSPITSNLECSSKENVIKCES